MELCSRSRGKWHPSKELAGDLSGHVIHCYGTKRGKDPSCRGGRKRLRDTYKWLEVAFIRKPVREGGMLWHRVHKGLSFKYFSSRRLFSFTFMILQTALPILGDHNVKSDDVIFAYRVLPMELSYCDTGSNSLPQPR